MLPDTTSNEQAGTDPGSSHMLDEETICAIIMPILHLLSVTEEWQGITADWMYTQLTHGKRNQGWLNMFCLYYRRSIESIPITTGEKKTLNKWMCHERY